MLKRIKYVSRMTNPLSHDELRVIREQSTRNNMASGITGVLMTSGGLFFQVIEGPVKAVDALWKTISDDARHRDVLLISIDENVRDRLFPDWAMETISLDASRADRLEPLHAILEAIVAGRQTVERLTGALERAIWAELVHNLSRMRETE
jgi:hypothetical protein